LGIENTGPVDRGFMDSIYFRDPNGQLLELACYKFEPPPGYTHSDVLATAHRIRVAAGDYNIADKHLADALLELAAQRAPKIEPAAPSTPVGVGAGGNGAGAAAGPEAEPRR
jgi:hypothetical protein